MKEMDCRQAMKEYMDQEIEVMGKLDLDEINDAINAIMDCRERGGTVYTMGNGGSAATASHLVCDFAKGLSEKLGGKKFRFECLCDNTSLVMAIANDISYEEVFASQLKGKLRPGDLVIAISGSGKSGNVLRAVEYAKEIGTPVIGMTGYDGGTLKELADFRMHVPADNIQIAEDIHMIFDHMLLTVMGQCEWKEEEIAAAAEDMDMKETIELYRNDQEMIVDAFDRVVVELFRENQNHGFKSFMICSCNAGVGSTSISMELAISLAVSGWNTVLIDGDLRKENRYKKRNQKVKYGLSDYIINQIDPEEILYSTNWEGLHYISCGHREDETPVKLLCSQKMGELTAYLKENYDFVIFDVPALNSAPDAAIVGGNADCAFLVAASSETKFHDLETARKQLEDGGVKLLGVILNKVPVDDYQHYMEDYNYFNDKEYLKRSRYYQQEKNEEKPKKPKKRASAGKFIRRLLCFLAVCALLGCVVWYTVFAAEGSGTPDAAAESGSGAASASSAEAPVVMLEGYRTDGPVVRGKEFTLFFTVRNMDPDMEVRRLRIGIYTSNQGGGYFLAQGKTNQIYVEQLPAGGTYEGAFTLQAMESLSAETIPLEIRCEYTSAAGSGTNSTIVSPTVSDLCEIEVMSLVTPERAVTGAKAFFSIQYKNSGLAELSKLTMRIHGNVVSNDEEVALAIPAPGRQEYVESSVIFTDAGSQELDVYLSYTDTDGVEYELGPLHAVTEVLRENGERDIYGTEIAWGEGNRRLVRRTDLMSMLQKIQQEYSWAVVILVGVLLADSLMRVAHMYRRRRTAKEGKKDEL